MVLSRMASYIFIFAIKGELWFSSHTFITEERLMRESHIKLNKSVGGIKTCFRWNASHHVQNPMKVEIQLQIYLPMWPLQEAALSKLASSTRLTVAPQIFRLDYFFVLPGNARLNQASSVCKVDAVPKTQRLSNHLFQIWIQAHLNSAFLCYCLLQAQGRGSKVLVHVKSAWVMQVTRNKGIDETLPGNEQSLSKLVGGRPGRWGNPFPAMQLFLHWWWIR